MLNHTYTSVTHLNSDCCENKKSRTACPTQYLLRDNFLGEYVSELDKKKVLDNLGIGNLVLEWEFIEGDIHKSDALMQELDSRTTYVSNIDNIYKPIINGILYLEANIGDVQIFDKYEFPAADETNIKKLIRKDNTLYTLKKEGISNNGDYRTINENSNLTSENKNVIEDNYIYNGKPLLTIPIQTIDIKTQESSGFNGFKNVFLDYDAFITGNITEDGYLILQNINEQELPISNLTFSVQTHDKTTNSIFYIHTSLDGKNWKELNHLIVYASGEEQLINVNCTIPINTYIKIGSTNKYNSSIGEINTDDNRLYFKLLNASFGLIFYEWIPILGLGSGIIPILYKELVNLRNNSNLTPGQKYRIIDYNTIVRETEEFTSAMHPFDIIVTALDDNTLSENAKVVHSDRDVYGYFKNQNLSVWEIKYSIDNDLTLYQSQTNTFVNERRFDWGCENVYYKKLQIGKTGYLQTKLINNSYYVDIIDYIYPYRNCYLFELEKEINDCKYLLIPNNYNLANELFLDGMLVKNEHYVHGVIKSIFESGYTVLTPPQAEVLEVINTGKGVIYYMKDEWGNEAPYDFKNILFNNLYTFGITEDDSLHGNSHNNIIHEYRLANKLMLNNILLDVKSAYNTFNANTYLIKLSSNDNPDIGYVQNIIIHEGCKSINPIISRNNSYTTDIKSKNSIELFIEPEIISNKVLRSRRK